jgi:hypothetical protein
MTTWRTLLNWLRQTRCDLFLGVYLLLSAAAWLLAVLLAGPLGFELADSVNLHWVWGAGVSLAYGGFRAVYFSPIATAAYGQQLRCSPWNYPEPLPLGPWQLTGQDLLLLVAIAAVAPGTLYIRLSLAMLPFAVAYSFCTWSQALAHRERWFGYALPALIGTAILSAAFWSIAGMLVVALAAVAAAQLSQRALLRQFHELDLAPRKKIFGIPLAADPQAATVGGAAAALLHQPIEWRWPPADVALAAAVTAWCAFAATLLTIAVHDYFDAGYSKVGRVELAWPVASLATLGVAGLAVVRVRAFLRYHASPLGPRGRLGTGRLVVPGFDNIFVAPAVALLWMTLGCGSLLVLGVYPPVAVALAVAVAVASLLGLPPSLAEWHQTGHHRLRIKPVFVPPPSHHKRL